MYPTAELSRLAARKTALRGDIALARARCAVAAAEVTRPFVWLHHALGFCRRLAAYARTTFNTGPGQNREGEESPPGSFLRSLLRWGPVAFAVVQEVRTATKPRV